MMYKKNNEMVIVSHRVSNTDNRKMITIERDLHKELKRIAMNERNNVSMYSLANDLLRFALNYLEYDKESGELL